MQEAWHHLQTHSHAADTFMVNGVIMSALKHDDASAALCAMELLVELGLDWDETTWEQMLKLEVSHWTTTDLALLRKLSNQKHSFHTGTNCTALLTERLPAGSFWTLSYSVPYSLAAVHYRIQLACMHRATTTI